MNSGHPKHLFLSLPKSQSDFAQSFGAIWNEALQVFEIPADEARLYSEEGQELFPFLLNAAVPKFYIATAPLQCWHCHLMSKVYGICLPNTTVLEVQVAEEFEDCPEMIFNRHLYPESVLKDGLVFSIESLQASFITRNRYISDAALEQIKSQTRFRLQMNEKTSKMVYSNHCEYCHRPLGDDYHSMIFEYSNTYAQVNAPLLIQGDNNILLLNGDGDSPLELIQSAAQYGYGML